jgi:hypothetical protein
MLVEVYQSKRLVQLLSLVALQAVSPAALPLVQLMSMVMQTAVAAYLARQVTPQAAGLQRSLLLLVQAVVVVLVPCVFCRVAQRLEKPVLLRFKVPAWVRLVSLVVPGRFQVVTLLWSAAVLIPCLAIQMCVPEEAAKALVEPWQSVPASEVKSC